MQFPTEFFTCVDLLYTEEFTGPCYHTGWDITLPVRAKRRCFARRAREKDDEALIRAGAMR